MLLLIFVKYCFRLKDEQLHIPGAVLSIDLRPNLVQHQQSLSLSHSLFTQLSCTTPAPAPEPFTFTQFPTHLASLLLTF